MAVPWPLAGGPETYPITRGSEEHVAAGEPGPAVDLACPSGTPVLALQDATVLVAVDGSQRTACGRQVDYGYVQEEHRYRVRCCHLARIDCSAGEAVDVGEQIGLAGMSGVGVFRPTGPHLHLVVWRDGERVRPEDYLSSGFAATDEDEKPEVQEDGMLRTPEQQQALDYLVAMEPGLRQWAEELATLRHGEYSAALTATANQAAAVRAVLEQMLPL